MFGPLSWSYIRTKIHLKDRRSANLLVRTLTVLGSGQAQFCHLKDLVYKPHLVKKPGRSRWGSETSAHFSVHSLRFITRKQLNSLDASVRLMKGPGLLWQPVLSSWTKYKVNSRWDLCSKQFLSHVKQTRSKESSTPGFQRVITVRTVSSNLTDILCPFWWEKPSPSWQNS